MSHQSHEVIGSRSSLLCSLALGLLLAGCAVPAGGLQPGLGASGSDPAVAAPSGADQPPVRLLAQASQTTTDAAEDEDYDPWEPFNERMFEFNLRLDRYVLKPAARGYRVVIPEPIQVSIGNAFDNLLVVQRVVNNVLQAKFDGALRELTRFVLNSTMGLGGLFDAGKHAGLESTKEDFGQTLAVWGSGPGPYLILPFLPPLTLRDGVGYGVDSVMNPLGWLLPLFPERIVLKAEEVVNERALNFDLFEGVEETTVDLYSAVRHFYLRRREQEIKR